MYSDSLPGGSEGGGTGAVLPLDAFRSFVFPNRIRERRMAAGFRKLMALAETLGDIPYIRLSKIERGEVTARAEELRRIAAAIGCPATDLLVDVDDPQFSIERWSEPFRAPVVDHDEHAFALKLAAALRVRRATDPGLTIAGIQSRFGIAPVMLSRLENGQKHWTQWNDATRGAVQALLGVPDDAALAAHVERQYAAGALTAALGAIDGPEQRMARTRERIAVLREELIAEPASTPAPPAPVEDMVPLIAVTGQPGPDGLILDRPAGPKVAAPPGCGPRLRAVRLCRPSLGGALPGQAILFADPDIYPVAGGLALLFEEGGMRALAVTIDQAGRLSGYSVEPARTIDLSDIAPDRLAAVVAARFL